VFRATGSDQRAELFLQLVAVQRCSFLPGGEADDGPADQQPCRDDEEASSVELEDGAFRGGCRRESLSISRPRNFRNVHTSSTILTMKMANHKSNAALMGATNTVANCQSSRVEGMGWTNCVMTMYSAIASVAR
jgi:hypothetical protein